MTLISPKRPEVVAVAPPEPDKTYARNANFAPEGARKTRFDLPTGLKSSSPVGYRKRLVLSREEANEAMALLAMTRPTGFAEALPVTEQEIFEESALGVLSSRQSTNFRGHRQVTLGPIKSRELQRLLCDLKGLEGEALEGTSYSHLIFSRPYRTPFTFLLTFVGHLPLLSLLTVPIRALRKRFQHIDDIPTIGFLQHLHRGILADAMERATVVASSGKRRAQVFMAPFWGKLKAPNRAKVRAIEQLGGLTATQRHKGWRLAIVAQIGVAKEGEEIAIKTETCRKVGANLLSFRSERIQPGVNADSKSPTAYQYRQGMHVPDDLVFHAGRAGYNAFCHWTNLEREQAKKMVLMERIDVLQPGGKERLRQLRERLNSTTDRLIKGFPLWADLPLGRALSRNANRGRKAFALAGQRIYIGGLSRPEIEAAGIDWIRGVHALGALASRGGLYTELMGCVELPQNCDLLSGVCMMAGPVNQADIGKTYYGMDDLLEHNFPGRDPTSMLVWTLKAKTVADPIGNEEQLLNAQRKGALVDLRFGPHECILLDLPNGLTAMRKVGDEVNEERAFHDQRNFVCAVDGRAIPGNRGVAWPEERAQQTLWASSV
jgi:hypothetical protein